MEDTASPNKKKDHPEVELGILDLFVDWIHSNTSSCS